MDHADKLGQQVIVAATLLSRRYRRQADRALENCGVPQAMAWPVLMLKRQSGLRQVELAEMLGIEGPSLVRQLDHIEAAGLIERREHPHDRRANTLHLTSAGRRLSVSIETTLRALATRSFAGISSADLETCLRVFNMLDANLERHAGEQLIP